MLVGEEVCILCYLLAIATLQLQLEKVTGMELFCI